jgi:hypothetical protein
MQARSEIKNSEEKDVDGQKLTREQNIGLCLIACKR